MTYLTSDSELSSSARVGALRSLFLWLSGAPPPWPGPVVPLARDWVLTANFLDASGVSAVEKLIHFNVACQCQEDECTTHTRGKDLLIKIFSTETMIKKTRHAEQNPWVTAQWKYLSCGTGPEECWCFFQHLWKNITLNKTIHTNNTHPHTPLGECE